MGNLKTVRWISPPVPIFLHGPWLPPLRFSTHRGQCQIVCRIITLPAMDFVLVRRKETGSWNADSAKKVEDVFRERKRPPVCLGENCLLQQALAFQGLMRLKSFPLPSTSEPLAGGDDRDRPQASVHAKQGPCRRATALPGEF